MGTSSLSQNQKYVLKMRLFQDLCIKRTPNRQEHWKEPTQHPVDLKALRKVACLFNMYR